MAKQPFYHRVVILFTSVNAEFDKLQFEKILRNGIKENRILKTSIEVEEIDAEPGDPADL